MVCCLSAELKSLYVSPLFSKDNVFGAEDGPKLYDVTMEVLKDVKNHVVQVVFPAGTFSTEQASTIAETAKAKKDALLTPIKIFLRGAEDESSPISLLAVVPDLLHVICAEAWQHQQFTSFKDVPEIP